MDARIQQVLDWYKVKTYKETSDGLIAIHKKIKGEWFWLYFRFNGIFYMHCGSTEKYSK